MNLENALAHTSLRLFIKRILKHPNARLGSCIRPEQQKHTSPVQNCALCLVPGIILLSLFMPPEVFQPKLNAVESSQGGLLLVCNKGDKTLGIVDPRAGQQVATVAEEGETGHEVVASPDGSRAFVPIYGNSGVGHPGTDGKLLRVIDLESRKIVGTIDFGKGVRPHCAVIGPKNGLLYVTTELENSITIIDPATLKIIGSVPTGQAESHMLA